MVNKTDWASRLDFEQAISNLERDFRGDWHKDPWGWPEHKFMIGTERNELARAAKNFIAHLPSPIDVPKDNWGSRPAVVLDIVDQVVYQALVDMIAVKLIGPMSTNAYGWRLDRARPTRGKYALERDEYQNFRQHLGALASHYEFALATDIVSCFASIQAEHLSPILSIKTGANDPAEALAVFIERFPHVGTRTGLPQRARASSVLANMFLSRLDDGLDDLPRIPRRADAYLHGLGKSTWVRWMDDIWVFSNYGHKLREVQRRLNEIATRGGLYLNSGKTRFLEGDEMRRVVKNVEHSAIDNVMSSNHDRNPPLEELVDRILEDKHNASRTDVKFALTRMAQAPSRYRVDELLAASDKMPHCADAFSRFAGVILTEKSREEWFHGQAKSKWTSFQWSLSNYLGIVSSSRVPSEKTLAWAAEKIDDRNTQLPLLAICCQRLQGWAPARARAVIEPRLSGELDPHITRVLGICGLQAQLPKTLVMRALRENDRTAVTARMLESGGGCPRVLRDYERGGPATS